MPTTAHTLLGIQHKDRPGENLPHEYRYCVTYFKEEVDMNSRQENILSMYLAVLVIVDKFNSVWSSLAAYSNAVIDFKALVDQLKTAVQTQELNLTGIAAEKGTLKREMANSALEVANSVFAYAVDQDDIPLQREMNYSFTRLYNIRDTLAMERAQLIHDKANSIVAGLVDYGVDTAELAALQTLIDDYSILIGAPRAAISERNTTTESISRIIQRASGVLTSRMDKLMENFRTSDPEFYESYFGSRKIIDSGVATALKGTVTDNSGLLVEGAEVSIEEQGISRLTNENGNYRFGRVAAGTFTITVTKEGYEPQTLEGVEIPDGQQTDLDFVLMPSSA